MWVKFQANNCRWHTQQQQNRSALSDLSYTASEPLLKYSIQGTLSKPKQAVWSCVPFNKVTDTHLLECRAELRTGLEAGLSCGLCIMALTPLEAIFGNRRDVGPDEG